jgi:hypothetical protein
MHRHFLQIPSSDSRGSTKPKHSISLRYSPIKMSLVRAPTKSTPSSNAFHPYLPSNWISSAQSSLLSGMFYLHNFMFGFSSLLGFILPLRHMFSAPSAYFSCLSQFLNQKMPSVLLLFLYDQILISSKHHVHDTFQNVYLQPVEFS